MKQDSIFSIENNTFQLKIENYYRKENHLTGFNRILKKKLSMTNSFREIYYKLSKYFRSKHDRLLCN